MGHVRFVVAIGLLCLLILPIGHAVDWIWIYSSVGSGSKQENTEYFEIQSTELLFAWEYTPDSRLPESTIFSFYVYEKDKESYIDFVHSVGSVVTNGTLKIHDASRGFYYIRLAMTNTSFFLIRVFEDAELRSVNIMGRYFGYFVGIVVLLFLTPLGAITLYVIRRIRKKRKET